MTLSTHVVIKHNKQGNIISLVSPYDGDKKINKPINNKLNNMKLKDLYIVPMIGFGFFDQEILVNQTHQKFKVSLRV